MKNSIKAAFFSGLVFPGLGHLAIKAYRRGTALLLTTFGLLVAFIAVAARVATTTLEKIQAAGGRMDLDSISAAAAQSTATSSNHALQLLLLGIVACWIFGIVDGYRVGRRADAESREPAG